MGTTKFPCLLLLVLVGCGVRESSCQQENTILSDEVNANLPNLNPQNFNPTVTASCRPSAGLMTVHVNTQAPFYGRITSRSSSATSSSSPIVNPCQKDGEGSTETSLTFNMQATANDTDYCGVTYSKSKNTYSIAISVRLHKTLELAEDKQYIVSCGKSQSSFSSPIKSPIRLVLRSVESGREIFNSYYGRSYKLGVEVSGSGKEEGFRVKECVAFGGGNGGSSTSSSNIVLFDENGCPESRIVSRWRYNDDPQTSSKLSTASTTIFSMFRFENSKRLTIQCVVYICENSDCSDSPDNGSDSSCPTIPAPLISPRVQFQRDTNETGSGGGGGSVLTSLTTNVLDVGENSNNDGEGKDLLVFEPEQCVGSICPRWLLWLVITLGVLFLLMLLVNLFLCSALTCTCTRTELIEKEPSIYAEDYDPYRSSWAGSQYGGSRYSLNPPHSQLSGAGHGGAGGNATNGKYH